MRSIQIKLFSFDELSEEAKEKVINRRINDMIEFESADHYDNWPTFKKAVDKAEQMQTPWFTGQYVFEYCGKEIVQTLEDDEEEIYLEDGRIHY